jgi:cytoskeletal protein CcmA (bactofilin family)
MWNKRREEEPPKPYVPASSGPTAPTRPAPVTANFTEPKKETTPVSSTPVGRIDSQSRNEATIGKAVKIVGQIYSKEDLFVDGDLEGTLEALDHRVTIGPHGTVHAAIKAREVDARGTIHGNVEAADKIEIRKDAKLVGDIKTARIIIEDGAYFKGSIDIVKPEPKAAPKSPAVQANAPAAAAPSGPVVAAASPETRR